MTVRKPHAILSDMILEGHARKPVCVSKTTFQHPLETDGCTILDADKISIEIVEQLDGDGGRDERADGSSKRRVCAVITGGYEEDDSSNAEGQGCRASRHTLDPLVRHSDSGGTSC